MKLYEKTIEKAKTESNWHIMRQLHTKTFKVFRVIIDQEIIENETIYLLNDLHCRYKLLFLETNENSTVNDIKGYPPTKLQEKLLSTYGDEITIVSSP